MFKFLDRKEKNSIVLIPGWAFDCGIFENLDLPYNYFLFNGSKEGSSFEEGLKKIMKKHNIKTVSLFGWSQGAPLAFDFARKNPDAVDELILVSARIRYKSDVLENIKKYIQKAKAPYLYSFYKECFSGEEKNALSWFKKRFLKEYLDKMTCEELTNGLDRLSGAAIEPELLEKPDKITIVHGAKDKIAPLGEALLIKDALPGAKLVVFENTGHLPFLRDDFRERIR